MNDTAFEGIDDKNAIAKLSQMRSDDARDYQLMLWLSKLRPFYAIERRLIVVKGAV